MFDKQLADLHNGVAEMLTVADSAIKLVTDIGQHLKDLLNEHEDDSELAEELEAYANQLTDKANALSAAVVANTPAAPSLISGEGGAVGAIGAGAQLLPGDPNAANSATSGVAPESGEDPGTNAEVTSTDTGASVADPSVTE